MAIQAKLKWTADMQFVARVGDGPAVVMDSSEGGSGPSPMQMMLMGVAGCTAIDVVSIMKKKRAEITKFEIAVDGEQAENHPRRFVKIRIVYTLYGSGIKSKAVEQAIDLSEKKYCSAMASLNADVEHSYEIKEG